MLQRQCRFERINGDVYAHTGVITDLSVDGHDWKYVMAPWPTNYSDIKLTRDSEDHYHLTIGNLELIIA